MDPSGGHLARGEERQPVPRNAPSIPRAFWLWWVLASAVGGALGYLVAVSVLATLSDGMYGALVDAVVLTMLGAGVGAMQWLVLRQHIPLTGWWVLASALGGTLAVAVAAAAPTTGIVLVGYGLLGTSMGVMQWLVLRQHVPHATWWLLASAVGWAVGPPAAQAINCAAALLPELETVGVALLFGIVAAVAGATTGIVLLWLMHTPIAGPSDSRQTGSQLEALESDEKMV